MTASRTTPTLCVLVIRIGPSRIPECSIQVVPVISPFPFKLNQAANVESPALRPRGRIAVTPVRTGPSPTTSVPCPRMIVLWPTSTPATSVIALFDPGVPVSGMPRARASGTPCAPPRVGAQSTSKTTSAHLTPCSPPSSSRGRTPSSSPPAPRDARSG